MYDVKMLKCLTMGWLKRGNFKLILQEKLLKAKELTYLGETLHIRLSLLLHFKTKFRKYIKSTKPLQLFTHFK